MTQECRIVFELVDITRIRVLCADCNGEITVLVTEGAGGKCAILPERICPYCGTP